MSDKDYEKHQHLAATESLRKAMTILKEHWTAVDIDVSRQDALGVTYAASAEWSEGGDDEEDDATPT